MIKIKPLSNHPGHIDALSRMWESNIAIPFLGNVSSRDIKSIIATSLNEDSLPLAFVALDGDKPIGMARLSIESDIPNLTCFPWLNTFFVDPIYRKKGIGKLLLNSMKSEAFKLGFKTLYTNSFDSESYQWFSKIGWKELGGEYSIPKSQKILLCNLSHSDLI